MKKYTILAVLLSVFGLSYAQDGASQGSGGSGDFAPAAGDISGAVLFGRGNFLTSGLVVPSSANPYWTVSGQAPYANNVDANNNDVTNIVGIEARYFLMDNIAIKISGGAITRNTPSMVNIPGYIDSGAPNSTWIPAYEAIKADNQIDANINIGGEYHFSSKYSRLFPYAGLTIPYYYGRRSMYDPTINDQLEPSHPQYIQDVGVRHAQLVGFGLQAVAGVDYYLAEGVYFGIETKPVSYIYAKNKKLPAPGLEEWEAETGTWSFLSQTFLKVGFRF